MMRDKFNRRLPALTHRNAPANIFKPTISHRLAIVTAEMNAERERAAELELQGLANDYGVVL